MDSQPITHDRDDMNKTHGRGANITIASLTLPSGSSSATPTFSSHTIESFLSMLNEQSKKAEEQDALNRAILKESTKKTFTPIRYSSDVPAGKRDVAAALCPNPVCQNVDNRFMLDETDKKKSSFVVVATDASSGQDLRCLCCNGQFKFCAGSFTHGKNNCIFIPLDFCRDTLGVYISKYV